MNAARQSRRKPGADPARVEQEGGPCCSKHPPHLTTDFKAETSAGERREEGVKHRAGWLGLLFWRRMDATHQAGTATSVTRDTAGTMRCFPQLLCLGWGCGHAQPAPGNMVLLLGPGVWPGPTAFLGKKMLFGAGLVQTPAQPQVSKNTLCCLSCLSGMS